MIPEPTPIDLFNLPPSRTATVDHARLPHNEDERRVAHVVFADLARAAQSLVVTAYSSLDFLIRHLDGDKGPAPDKPVRLLLGNDPHTGTAPRLRGRTLQDEARTYWLERGISIALCGPVTALLDALREGHLQVRTLDRLHAKIYLTPEAATLGSSNFSHNGFHRQHEANARFLAPSREYRDVSTLAEGLWVQAIEASTWFADLLETLLRPASWQEALARAGTELLDGAWIDRYPRSLGALRDAPLWPSQRTAIAQALYLLDTRGSALVADPAGSGKTRLGAFLLFALVNRLWASGRGMRTTSAVVAPPLIGSAWQRELGAAHLASCRVISQGVLNDDTGVDVGHLHTARLLFVDEAHNYLNPGSKRSRRIEQATADHVVLFTATPLNRGAQDLLRLVELLGVDNLSNEEFELYRSLRKRRGAFTQQNRHDLRELVRTFTLRRLRSDLNALVDADPSAFLDADGQRCRYPEHHPELYATGDTASDEEVAMEIDAAAGKLRGLLWLRTLTVPPYHVDGTVEQLVAYRLAAARALARHVVRAAMRSSAAALVEHLDGLAAAASHFGFDVPHKGAAGNVIGRLEAMRADGLLPKANVPPEALEPWLYDPTAVAQAIDEEIDAYRTIARLTRSLSESRQLHRLSLLRETHREHDRILGFDRSIVTLHYVQHLARQHAPELNITVVTGSESASTRRRLLTTFGREATGRGIAFCSDALAEGVNLQGASAVVFFDAPSVIRLAEQRLGRVDRMDSPHRRVVSFWPKDPPAFTLRASERLVGRHNEVEQILGANLQLPDGMTDDLALLSDHDLVLEETSPESLAQFNRAREAAAAVAWDGLQDAFAPVRALLDGEEALVPRDVADAMRGATARVVAHVSVVASPRPWAFFALRGAEGQAPRWVLIDERSSVISDLPTVCAALRERLPGADSLSPAVADVAAIESLTKALVTAERSLLPPRQRHALELLEAVVTKRMRKKEGQHSAALRRLYYALNAGRSTDYEGGSVDLSDLADAWLAVVRPRLAERRALPTKPGRPPSFVRLLDLEGDLVGEAHDELAWAKLSDGLVERPAALDRVAAAIIGLPFHSSRLA